MQVKYCNDNSIEFLTRKRGHGGTMSLNSFQGLQINMNQLQGIEIQDDGETALLQGGAYAGPVIETLWDQGYVTSEFALRRFPTSLILGWLLTERLPRYWSRHLRWPHWARTRGWSWTSREPLRSGRRWPRAPECCSSRRLGSRCERNEPRGSVVGHERRWPQFWYRD